MNLLLYIFINGDNFGFVICIIAKYCFWCVIKCGNREGKKIRGIDSENIHSVIFGGE